MAAPSVTAAATAVYQYLRDGHYYHMIPIKASLIKAMLVHSTVPMLGRCGLNYNNCNTFVSRPNTVQGHGRVVLKNVLHFSETQGWDLFLDIATLADSASEIQYDIDLLSLAAFKVTLVWTDPGSSSSSNTLLVNDIDLTVIIVPTGKVVYANGKSSKDHFNNVEVISLSEDDLRGYFSNESSHHIRVVVGVTGLSCSQEYSIVITGDFDALSLASHFATTAPRPPVEPSAKPQDDSSFSFVEILVIFIICVVFLVILWLFMSSYAKKAKKRQLKTVKKAPSNRKDLHSPHLPTRPPVGRAVSLASSLSSSNDIHQKTTNINNNKPPLKPMMPSSSKPLPPPSSSKPLPPPSSSKPLPPPSSSKPLPPPSSSKPAVSSSHHPAMSSPHYPAVSSPSSKPTILPPPSLQQTIQERVHSSPPPLPGKSQQHSYHAVVLAPTKGNKPTPGLPSKPTYLSPRPPPGLKKNDHSHFQGHSHMVPSHHHQGKPLPELPAKREMNDIGLMPQNDKK